MEWSAASAAGLGAIGGALISGVGSYLQGESSARATERMYKHRYQWQMKDMKKAGLNPMLAFMQGAPVPQSPMVPNVGEAVVRGASGGASSALAARLGNAQLTNIQADTANKAASAKASESLANKTAVETSLLGQFGSAKQTAEIDQIRQNISESISRMANQSMQLDLSMQEFMHNEKNFPLIRELNAALAQAKAAEIPLKEVVGMLAGMFGELISKARTETEARDYSTLGRDTINLIEDKWDKISPWQRFKRWDQEKRGIK